MRAVGSGGMMEQQIVKNSRFEYNLPKADIVDIGFNKAIGGMH